MISRPVLPHYLLFAEARVQNAVWGKWQFTLEPVSGDAMLSAGDSEMETSRDRLYLLAVMRGLEALNQPSRVTLVTASRYVCRGLRRHLDVWKADDWMWEWQGQLAPIANADLWQRIDRALEFHELECRRWRFDPAQLEERPPASTSRFDQPVTRKAAPPKPHWLRRVVETFAS